MPPTEEERNYGIGLVVDVCSDIRALHGALVLLGPAEKLDGEQAVAQEENTKALSTLEGDLDLHYDTLIDLGMSHDKVREILVDILPPGRYVQLLERKDEPVPA